MAMVQQSSSGTNNPNLSATCLTFFRCERTQVRCTCIPPSPYTVARDSRHIWSKACKSSELLEGNFFFLPCNSSYVKGWKIENTEVTVITHLYVDLLKDGFKHRDCQPWGQGHTQALGEKRSVNTEGILEILV